MKTSPRLIRPLWAGVVLATFLAGCHTTPTSDAVKLDGTEFPDLGPYQVVTVAPVALGPKAGPAGAVAQQLAEDVGASLRSAYGSVFSSVRVGQPLGRDNEMVVSCLIETFDPGQGGTAGGVTGTGSPKLDGQMRLQDAADGEDLAYASFGELRKNAGTLEAVTAPGLIAQTGAAIAFNVARAKGWRPAGSR